MIAGSRHPIDGPTRRAARRRYDGAVPPLIGLTCDVYRDDQGRVRFRCPATYCAAVAGAGGVPVLLPADVALIPALLERCDGFLLTGGDDPAMEPFGAATHPRAELVDPQRQAFETALVQALAARPATPVLGVCLGMQMMALVAGATLHQHLPDVLGDAAATHAGDRRHAVALQGEPRPIEVVSSHHQAVADAGTLAVVGRAPDGVVEAVANPARPLYLGVQWHPERGLDEPFSRGLFERLIAAARDRRR